MGGYQKDEESEIMDILLFNNGEFSADQKLPWGLAESCAVPLEGRSSIMITGGVKDASVFPLMISLKLNHHQVDKFQFTLLLFKELNVGRKSHGCARARLNSMDVVIIAGGETINDQGEKVVLNSVEYIDLDNLDGWVPLNSLNMARTNKPTVGFVDNTLVVAGGSGCREEHQRVVKDGFVIYSERSFYQKILNKFQFESLDTIEKYDD
jgi:hypothetical protein